VRIEDHIGTGGFSNAQRAIFVALGSSAGIMPSLQPLLLGAMLDQHRIATAQIGQAAAAEAIGMALSVTVASSMYRSTRLAPALLVALGLLAVTNIATAFSTGSIIVALRAIAGMGGGMLIWTLLAMVTRQGNPGRVFAIYVSVQSALGFAISTLFSRFLIPVAGPAGAYATLAGINLLLCATIAFIPRIETAPSTRTHRLPPVSGLIALGGTALFMCGIMAFWSYAAPLIREITHAGVAADVAIPMVIGVHILGGLVAAISSRFSPMLVCVCGPMAIITCMAAVIVFESVVVQHALLLLFAFIWMFVPPFQLPFLLNIDPSARSAMYVSSGHLTGIAVGPFLASLAVTRESVFGAMGVALICLAGAAALPVVARYLIWRSEGR